MEKLILPDLYCPFPSQINTYAGVLEDYAFEWVLRFNLLPNESTYQHFLKTNFFWLTSCAYPNYNLEELKIGNLKTNLNSYNLSTRDLWKYLLEPNQLARISLWLML
jgi:hypothetical protein